MDSAINPMPHENLHEQRAFGYPIVITAALTGFAVFTQLKDNPAWWAKLTVAIASAVAAVLAACKPSRTSPTGRPKETSERKFRCSLWRDARR
jgi:hypothetical protein